MKITTSFSRGLLSAVAAVVLLSTIIVGCKKEQHEVGETEILNSLKSDKDFHTFIRSINQLVAVSTTSSVVLINESPESGSGVSKEVFLKDFEEAFSQNNVVAQKRIASTFGFQHSNDFLVLKNTIHTSLSNIVKRYNFKKVSEGSWRVLVKNFRFETTGREVDGIKSSYALDNCIEQFNDCMDEAKALYAVEAIACGGWGALGWTIIGGAFFVACEGSAYYHLKTMKKKCNSSYNGCIAPKQ